MSMQQGAHSWLESPTQFALGQHASLDGRKWTDSHGREHALTREFGAGTGKRAIVGHFTFSVGTHHEKMCVGLMACNMTEQVEACGVCPLQIVKGKDQCMWCTKSLEEHPNRFIQPEAGLFRGQGSRRGKLTETGDQFWQERGKHLRCCSNVCTQLVQRGHLNIATKSLHEWQIGGHALRLRCATLEDGRPILSGPPGNFVQETRLANPWLPCQKQHMGMPSFGRFIVAHNQC